MRSVVVLPAPLGPSRPKTSPGLSVEADVIDGVHDSAAQIAERFRKMLDVDHEDGILTPLAA